MEKKAQRIENKANIGDMQTLHLILNKKYYEEIRSGKKTNEYRLVTSYWIKKLVNREYSHIIFQLGYSKKNRITVEYLGYDLTTIKHEFFGNEDVSVFALKLGGVTEIKQ